jgi:lipid A 4'-phosphatase
MSSAAGDAAVHKGHGQIALWGWCLGGCLVAGILFYAFPGIDLWVSRAFYSPSTGFVGHHHAWVAWLRRAFIVFYWVCMLASVAGWVAALRGRQTLLGADPRKWLFLVLCLSIGPGLLANLVFKDQWGRARPKHVVEFGGTKRFTPAPLPADQCRRGCAFVSGEAATAFVPFYAAAAIVPQWGATLVVAGTISGLAAGSLRIALGAHFLSDVVFAGLSMALTVLALRPLIRTPSQPRDSTSVAEAVAQADGQLR